MSYRVAIVGATGLVGGEFLRILEERKFPMDSLRLYASDRSAGKKLAFMGEEIVVEETGDNSFGNIDIALFSAGGDVSKRFAPIAARAGAVANVPAEMDRLAGGQVGDVATNRMGGHAGRVTDNVRVGQCPRSA